MNALDIFAWSVLTITTITVGIVFIVLARLPGKIAAQRGHPQAEAINVAGWLGALAMGVFWPFALVWAFTRPTLVQSQVARNEIANPGIDQ